MRWPSVVRFPAVDAILPILCVVLSLPEADPPLSDLDRFPCLQTATANRWFAAEHRRWLCKERELWPGNENLATWWSESLECYQAWDELENACGFFRNWSTGQRRAALGRLRDMLGRREYELGLMPVPAPVWFFERRD